MTEEMINRIAHMRTHVSTMVRNHRVPSFPPQTFPLSFSRMPSSVLLNRIFLAPTFPYDPHLQPKANRASCTLERAAAFGHDGTFVISRRGVEIDGSLDRSSSRTMSKLERAWRGFLTTLVREPDRSIAISDDDAGRVCVRLEGSSGREDDK